MPEGAISQAGFTPLHITNISTFDLSTIDVLMFNESNNNGPSSEVNGRLSDIQAWVESGGVFLVHDRFVSDDSGDPQPNPFLLGATDFLVDRDMVDGADLDVIATSDTLVTDGPHGVIDNGTLDGGNYSNHGFALGDSLTTAPDGTENILSAGADPNHVASFSYQLGSGYIYYSTIPLDFYLSGDNNFNDIYAPNMLVYGHSLVQPEVDFYQVELPPLTFGGQLHLNTSIPGAGLGQPVSALDPMVRVYDAAGNLVATADNTELDNNVDLVYALPASTAAAQYFIEVLSSNLPMVEPTKGPYVLDVGLVESPPPAGITFNKTSIVTSEPDVTDTFTVVLDAEPSASVTLAISSSDDSEGLVAVAEQGSTLAQGPVEGIVLIFTPADWDTPQTVTVHGQDDDIADDDTMYTIVTGTPVGASEYQSLDPIDLSAVNLDDDAPGITVTPTEGLVTTEEIPGGTAAFTVVLDTKPSRDVVINVESSNTDEGTVSIASLTFTTVTDADDGWNRARSVTLTGQDDFIDDGNVAYTITLTPTGDAVYTELGPVTAAAVNIDNEDSPDTSELDFFEDGDITEYGSTGTDIAFSVNLGAARDGYYGLVGDNGGDWIYRKDAQVAQGDILSAWVCSDGEPTGRAYFGFGAKTKGKPSGQGTLSIVMAPNSNQLMLHAMPVGATRTSVSHLRIGRPTSGIAWRSNGRRTDTSLAAFTMAMGRT